MRWLKSRLARDLLVATLRASPTPYDEPFPFDSQVMRYWYRCCAKVQADSQEAMKGKAQGAAALDPENRALDFKHWQAK